MKDSIEEYMNAAIFGTCVQKIEWIRKEGKYE